MQLIDIRLGSGILIVAPPLGLDPVLKRADDPWAGAAAIRAIHLDRYAMGRIRLLYPMLASQGLDPIELSARFRNDLRTGRFGAVYLRESGCDAAPLEVPDVRSHIVHVETPEATILLTARGMLPSQFKDRAGGGHAAGLLASLDPEGPAIRMLERQAERLTFGIDEHTTGEDLKRSIAQHLRGGVVEAAVLTSRQDIAAAKARRETPVPIENMTPGQRVAEALNRSRRHMTDEMRAVMDELVKPENLGGIASTLLGAATAQSNPLTSALLDSSLVMIAWDAGGMKAVSALGKVFDAVQEASKSNLDETLDKAVEQLVIALNLLGAGPLQMMMARSFTRKGGTQAHDGGNWSAKLSDPDRKTERAQTPSPRREQPLAPRPPVSKPAQEAAASEYAAPPPPPPPPAPPPPPPPAPSPPPPQPPLGPIEMVMDPSLPTRGGVAKLPKKKKKPAIKPVTKKVTKSGGPTGANKVTWTTDILGRPLSGEAVLKELMPSGSDRGSDELAAQKLVRALGLDDDDAGHMFGHRFLGDMGARNMFPQNFNFNRGPYKKMENEWADWIKTGHEVHATVTLIKTGKSARPNTVKVSYYVTKPGSKKVVKARTQTFSNKAGEKFDRIKKVDM